MLGWHNKNKNKNNFVLDVGVKLYDVITARFLLSVIKSQITRCWCQWCWWSYLFTERGGQSDFRILANWLSPNRIRICRKNSSDVRISHKNPSDFRISYPSRPPPCWAELSRREIRIFFNFQKGILEVDFSAGKYRYNIPKKRRTCSRGVLPYMVIRVRAPYMHGFL